MSFDFDLEQSQKKELQLIAFLQGIGYAKVTSSQSRGEFSEYDIAVYDAPDSTPFYIELKYDRKSSVTGNIAVELYTINSDGSKRFSGLTSSKADLYAYCFPDDEGFYFISHEGLRELSKRKFDDVVYGGDNGKVCLVLLKKAVFIENCLRLN